MQKVDSKIIIDSTNVQRLIMDYTASSITNVEISQQYYPFAVSDVTIESLFGIMEY